MSLLEVTTASSRWLFDREAKTYTRQPRVEGADHPNIGYEDGARSYEGTVEVTVGETFVVYLPGFSWIRGGRVEEIREVETT
jgi:hypothetical protein